MIQIPGKGLRLAVNIFHDQMLRSPAVTGHVLQFSQALTVKSRILLFAMSDMPYQSDSLGGDPRYAVASGCHFWPVMVPATMTSDPRFVAISDSSRSSRGKSRRFPAV